MNYNFEENLMWPPYRDYTSELHELHKDIHLFYEVVRRSKSIEIVQMASLMKAEVKLKKLIDDFAFTAWKVVNIIVHWKP